MKKAVASIIGLVVASLLIYLIFENAAEPSASLTLTEKAGILRFDITTHHVNGILGLRVWNFDQAHTEALARIARHEDDREYEYVSNEYLWDVNLDYYQGPHLDYGEVPQDFATFNGGRNSAKQNFPKDGAKPHPLPPSTRIRMAIDLQYDTWAAASVTTRYFDLLTDREGHVTKIMPTPKLGGEVLTSP
jgi:hypothetical protein